MDTNNPSAMAELLRLGREKKSLITQREQLLHDLAATENALHINEQAIHELFHGPTKQGPVSLIPQDRIVTQRGKTTVVTLVYDQ